MNLRHLLAFPGQLRWPLNLPSVDPWEIEAGEEYQPFLRARDVTGKKTEYIVSDNPFAKYGTGAVPAHAGQEQRIQLAAFFCPHVLDIRSQYYYGDEETDRLLVLRAITDRNQLPTLDLMLTILCPWTRRIVYHAINVKPKEMQRGKAFKNRVARDLAFCNRWGFTYEVLCQEEFSKLELGNHWALFSRLRFLNRDAVYRPAWEFARMLNSSTASGTADRVLGMVGRRFGVGLDNSHRLFAAAVFFGFVRLDMGHMFRSDKELVLLGDCHV